MRHRKTIDSNWLFQLGDDSRALEPGFDDSGWRVVDLPHDWSVEATPDPDNPAQAGGGFFPGGLGWYRKELNIPEDLGDRRMLIEFDGVYMNSEVWCNGRFCGVRPYGYSSFCYDITPFVTPGEPAVIAVRVDNSRQKNSRWYSGSGIYRHVWLTLASPVRVDHWGTCLKTTDVSAESATIECDIHLVNDREEAVDVEIRPTVIDPAGGEVSIASAAGGAFTLPPGKRTSSADVVLRSLTRETAEASHASLRFAITPPSLWSPDTPALYTLRLDIYCQGQTVDTHDTRFGIRAIRFDADQGFFLNGANIKLRGVNEHHDAGCLGAAVPDDVIRRRFRILKQMGCNAIRVAHNPASPTFLDLCDEMGFMVVEDAFDEWRDGKTPFGYQLYWDQWWERDLVDMIHRDRNHPSIVMWSVGNEIKEVRMGRSEGLPMMEALREVCHREDPTRPMTCGCCNTRETLAAGYQNFMDIMGYNGGGGGCFDYEKDHAAYPEMVMFASEVPHSLQTRGVYRTRTWYRDLARNPAVERLEVPHYTDEELFIIFDKHYQSSYDNAMVRISSIDSWRFTRDLPFMCGEFRWTGFDYLGECYGWPAKSWNFGIIDLCGFPKDTYYFYQSQWTSTPMVHVLPHWSWPGFEGKTIPVIAYSNCDTVELFLDDKSLGIQNWDNAAMQLRWDVPYQPGTLKAVGYRDGKEAATCVHETAGQAAALTLSADAMSIRADGTGIGHVVVTVVDAEGRFVPHAHQEITVEVEGPATLIGLENGDPIDSTNYKLNHRHAFHGMMLAIVQSTGTVGTITVTACAEGLEAGNCVVVAEAVKRPRAAG
ncbi:MAG: glycoside hydrolase family 2 TIM barrel-domain containing protein [Lentisphaeria bacterium]|nr:glycoside hydrolase family 2 TIM barrel-domain containing protein [Lentisphaeria bacterium]